MKRFLLFICLLIVVLPGFPILAQNSLNPQTADTLQAILDEAIQAGNPGIVLWVDSPMGNFEGAGGYADVDAGIALQPTDSFRIGSITKTFTSTIILQLVEEGVLDLDDKLVQWLPETAATLPYGDQITLRQLLNHTAGVFNWANDEETLGNYIQDVEMQQHQWLPEEMVAIAARHEADFTPGEAFAYSNTGYALLGMVIEAATGKTLAENYHQRILDPLGMSHTYLSNFEEPTSALVHGYSDYLQTDNYNASFAGAGGALVSNAPDLVIFFRALMTNQLFSDDATLQTMRTGSEQSVNQLTDNSEYGLGIMHFSSPIGDAYAHDGSIFGFNAAVMYFADYDMVFVMLVNADESQVEMESVLGALTELVEAEPAS